jgi:tetratricopeptide (TPR) repeat protein
MPRTKNFILVAAALALVSATTALAQKPDVPPVANDKFESGKQMYEQGDLQRAIPLLRDAAELFKTNADAWYVYGLALNRAGRAKEASKAFQKTLKLRPDDALAHVGLAYTLLYVNKLRDAEREAERALQLNPQLAEAHYVVGVIRFAGEKFPAAADEAEAALRLKPGLAAAAFLLGDAWLNEYADEAERLSEKYPLTPTASDAERKAVVEKREAELEQFKARLRGVADRLEAFVKSQPDGAEVTRVREQVESLRLYGQAGSSRGGVFLSGDVMQRAVVTSKPEPSYTTLARQNNVKGVVRLRAVLAADGHVRYIIPIKRLPDGLTEQSIEAARQIKFTPATIDGRPVSQFIVLEYNFNIY